MTFQDKKKTTGAVFPLVGNYPELNFFKEFRGILFSYIDFSHKNIATLERYKKTTLEPINQW